MTVSAAVVARSGAADMNKKIKLAITLRIMAVR